MAARRIAKSSVDWALFAKRIPENQIPQYTAFKVKSDGYIAKLVTLPDALPAINWQQYQSTVAVPNMVNDFKKQYEALKIPYPKDTVSHLVEKQEKEGVLMVTETTTKSKANIAKLLIELVRVEAMLPVEDMFMEEYYEAFPAIAIDTFDKPSMWPHNPESQIEYIEQMMRDGKFDDHED